MTAPVLVTVAVDALLDELAIKHLDFAPACEARVAIVLTFGPLTIRLPAGEPCGRDACGVVTCRWCGTSTTSCADHSVLAVESAEIECRTCHCFGPGPSIFRFTPWVGA